MPINPEDRFYSTPHIPRSIDITCDVDRVCAAVIGWMDAQDQFNDCDIMICRSEYLLLRHAVFDALHPIDPPSSFLAGPSGREAEPLMQAGPGDEIAEMKQEEIHRRRRLDEQRDRLRK